MQEVFREHLPTPENIEASKRRGSKACKGRRDGSYSIDACSHKYLVCSNDVAWISECAADLYYDARTRHCEHKERVPDCHVAPSTPAEVLEQAGTSGGTVSAFVL